MKQNIKRIKDFILLKNKDLERKTFFRLYKVFSLILTFFVLLCSFLYMFNEIKHVQSKYVTKDYLQTYITEKNLTPERTEKLITDLVDRGYTLQGHNDKTSSVSNNLSQEMYKRKLTGVSFEIFISITYSLVLTLFIHMVNILSFYSFYKMIKYIKTGESKL